MNPVWSLFDRINTSRGLERMQARRRSKFYAA